MTDRGAVLGAPSLFADHFGHAARDHFQREVVGVPDPRLLFDHVDDGTGEFRWTGEPELGNVKLVDGADGAWSLGPPDRLDIEESGPVRAVVRAEGPFQNSDRARRSRYRVRYVKVTDLCERDLCREIATAAGVAPAGTYPTLVRRLQERFANDNLLCRLCSWLRR